MPKPNWAYLTYMSTSRIELGLEVNRHPDLCEILLEHRDESPEIIIGHIAAYCEVAVDGSYTIEELDTLCETLTKILYSKRSLLVVPPGYHKPSTVH